MFRLWISRNRLVRLLVSAHGRQNRRFPYAFLRPNSTIYRLEVENTNPCSRGLDTSTLWFLLCTAICDYFLPSRSSNLRSNLPVPSLGARDLPLLLSTLAHDRLILVSVCSRALSLLARTRLLLRACRCCRYFRYLQLRYC